MLSGAMLRCEIAARTFSIGKGKLFPRLSQVFHSVVYLKMFPQSPEREPNKPRKSLAIRRILPKLPSVKGQTNLGKALLFEGYYPNCLL